MTKWRKGVTYFLILPSNLNMATCQLDLICRNNKLTSITALISTTEMQWLVDITQEVDEETK